MPDGAILFRLWKVVSWHGRINGSVFRVGAVLVDKKAIDCAFATICRVHSSSSVLLGEVIL